jgi:hypothetical protein
MAVECERGISVSSAVMSFEDEGLAFSLLDTPGHQDFSEDTYRTLTAVDSLVDTAQGHPQRHQGASRPTAIDHGRSGNPRGTLWAVEGHAVGAGGGQYRELERPMVNGSKKEYQLKSAC